MDPLTLVALLGPLIKSGGQALINKWSKGQEFVPTTADDVIKIMQANTEALKARASVGDTEGPTWMWVTAMVKMQRPVIVYGTITAWLIMEYLNIGLPNERQMVGDMAQVVIFWLFGERTLLKLETR